MAKRVGIGLFDKVWMIDRSLLEKSCDGYVVIVLIKKRKEKLIKLSFASAYETVP